MQAKIDSLESAVRELTALYKSRAQGPNRPQGGGLRPGDRPRGERNKQRFQNIECYGCWEKGHISRDCKATQNKDESARDLNGKGSGVRPIPDPVSRRPFEGGFRVQMPSTWPGKRGWTARSVTPGKVPSALLHLKMQPELPKNQLVQAGASARLCAL